MVLLGCQKSVSKIGTPGQPATSTVLDIDVSTTVKTLNGTEGGINLNYLMDDSYLPGQTYQTVKASLQQLGVKFLRYPGGEKSDNYLFGKAPYTMAAPGAAYCNFPASDPRFYNADLTAKQVVLDFDEYMTVCRQLNATPFIVVAYDAMYSTSTCGPRPTRTQLISNAVEWVRYANITKGYNVKYWMIGNESWNDADYNGRVSPATYAADIVAFADAMRSIDPTISIVANGRSNDNWWQTLLQSSAAAKVDYLATSNYLPQGFTGYDHYRTFDRDLNTGLTEAENALDTYAAPADKNRIGIILSEYSSIDYYNSGWGNVNDLGHALCNFQMQADALLHSRLLSACLWNTRWITNAEQPYSLYDAFNATGNLNATGTALSIMGKNLFGTMVKATDSTATVLVYASRNPLNNYLNVFILNKDTLPEAVMLNIRKHMAQFKYRKSEFTGTGVLDKSPVWSSPAAVYTGSPGMGLTLAAHSVTLLEIRDPGGF